jgi:hypothetical protein
MKMLPEKFLQILKYEGVVAMASQGRDGPHLVNSWHSYVQITADEHLLIPVGGMNQTEKNVSENSRVLLTVGSREVEGRRGPGTGFLIIGTAEFISAGKDFDLIKEKFPWARASLKVEIGTITQTL